MEVNKGGSVKDKVTIRKMIPPILTYLNELIYE